uniref:Uncharacterized protein n=1 Tax=Arundo donax TaxID=35708 RepID=A0A0A9ACN9_ARUDO
MEQMLVITSQIPGILFWVLYVLWFYMYCHHKGIVVVVVVWCFIFSVFCVRQYVIFC